jgi:hypothetical protein
MPGLSSTSFLTVDVYRHANSLPSSVWDAFRRRERDMNIIYPHAQAQRGREQDNRQLWMTCSTVTPELREATLDLILTCTEGPIGPYPIFIVPAIDTDALGAEFLQTRLAQLVDSLLEYVPMERVFSIFAPQATTVAFAHLWSRQTGISFYRDPYYAAKLSRCNSKTFINQKMSDLPNISYEPRLAVMNDTTAVASLCQDFAATSVSGHIL